jgi:hypothetical protein
VAPTKGPLANVNAVGGSTLQVRIITWQCQWFATQSRCKNLAPS